MLFRIDETLLVGFDHCGEVAGTHWLLLGWVMAPTSEAFPALILHADGIPCRTLHFSTCPRRDITVPEEKPATVLGFALLAAVPPAPLRGARRFSLAVAARGIEAAIALPAKGLGPDLAQALAGCDWTTAQALLSAGADGPDRNCLVETGSGPLGAFSGWLERVPVVPHGTERFHTFAPVLALASPAGEFALHLGFEGPPVRHVAVTALALLPRGSGTASGEAAGRLRPVRFGDLLVDAAARHVSVYGCLPLPAEGPGTAEEILLQLDRDAERHWVRLCPRPLPVPAFLEAQEAARLAVGCTDPGSNHAWLRALVLSREQAMRPWLGGLGLLDRIPAREARPVLAIVLGLDDPICVRLIHLAAAELERHCTELVLLGREATAAAQVLIHRGRVPVRVGAGFLATARHGAHAGSAVVLTEATALAEALAADRLPALFAEALPGERLAGLLALSACTGTGEPADALWRLMRLRAAPGTDGPAAVPRYAPAAGRGGQAAGQEVRAHLQRLWRMLEPAVIAADGALAGGLSDNRAA